MDAVKIPVKRHTPVRASTLPHPRLPRHLLRQQHGEADEEKVGRKLADQGDSNMIQRAALPEKKELSVVERHQLHAPAQMLAQLRKNSLESASQPLLALSPPVLPQDRASSPAASQAQTSANTATLSQHLNASESSRQVSVFSPAKRRQLMTDLQEQKRSKLEQTGSSVTVGKPSSTEQAEDEDMRSLRVKVMRSLSLDTDNQKGSVEDATDSGKRCTTTPAPTFPRRNSLHDLRSVDPGSLNSQLSAPLEPVKHYAIPMFMAKTQNLLQKAYQPFLKYSLNPCTKTENETAASSVDSCMASCGEDSSRMDGALFAERTVHISSATKRASSYEDVKSIVRADPRRDCKNRVNDLESMMETLGVKRVEKERDEQPGPHSPVCKRHFVANGDGPYPKKTKRNPASTALNFCKLQFGEGDESYFVTVVGLEMDKLVEIHAVLNERSDAKIVKCGVSSEDLVDELGDQMGVQLVMQKLHSLPPRGRYSVHKLLNLSTSHFSHCTPNKWDETMARFEREGIEEVLLRPEAGILVLDAATLWRHLAVMKENLSGLCGKKTLETDTAPTPDSETLTSSAETTKTRKNTVGVASSSTSSAGGREMSSKRSRGMSGGKCQTRTQQRTQPQQQQYYTGVPSGLQQTGITTAGGKKTFEHTPANGQVLVVMRYKRERDRSIRNCIVRMLGRIRQPGTEGKCLGITNEVHVLECPDHIDWAQRDDWCIALFLFPSEKNAQRWYESEKELKQHDFLPPSDGVQLFVVKLRYLPKLDRSKLTFNWMELYNVQSNSFLQTEFVNKVCPLLDDQQVNHGLVFLQDSSHLFRLKESWIAHKADAYCVVNVYDNEEHFEKVFQQKNYADLLEKRNIACDTVSLLFTIDSNITGPPANRT
ncbi:hypothetical protein ACOMHN_011043 [Nucella lapillus]